MARPVETNGQGARVLNAVFGPGAKRDAVVTQSGAVYRVATAAHRQKLTTRGEVIAAERAASAKGRG